MLIVLWIICLEQTSMSRKHLAFDLLVGLGDLAL